MIEKVALVHSGGGRFGAHQVGATKRLYEKGVRPRIFSGTSVGIYNCGHLAQYDHRKVAGIAIDKLAERWKSINTKDVWKQHFPFGIMHGTWRTSLYDSKPMRDLLRKWFDPSKVRASGNELYMGVVSLNGGSYHVLDINHPAPYEAMAASAAMPLFFEPREVSIPGQGMQLCGDGGAMKATPLRAAFRAGATQIYVCLTEAEGMTYQKNFNNVMDVGPRFIALMAHSIFMLDLELALAENELARHNLGTKRFVNITVIRPQHPLEGDPMDFDPARSEELMELGYEDAKKVVG